MVIKFEITLKKKHRFCTDRNPNRFVENPFSTADPSCTRDYDAHYNARVQQVFNFPLFFFACDAFKRYRQDGKRRRRSYALCVYVGLAWENAGRRADEAGNRLNVWKVAHTRTHIYM